MKKILLVDDDKNFQKVVLELLEFEGYMVDAVNHPIDGLDLFKKNEYDLVITDLKMDDLNGLQLLSMIRRISPNAKVIIITGSNSIADEVQGLDLDVDDYIQKPFAFEVFTKRVEKVLKKEKTISMPSLLTGKNDDIVVNVDKREVKQNNLVVDLTRKEFDLLTLLLSNKNRVLERETIIDKIWHNPNYYVDNRTVDTHVKNLRNKLVITSLYTVRGIGYEWIE